MKKTYLDMLHDAVPSHESALAIGQHARIRLLLGRFIDRRATLQRPAPRLSGREGRTVEKAGAASPLLVDGRARQRLGTLCPLRPRWVFGQITRQRVWGGRVGLACFCWHCCDRVRLRFLVRVAGCGSCREVLRGTSRLPCKAICTFVLGRRLSFLFIVTGFG